MRAKRKIRLVLEFGSEDSLIEWVQAAADVGAIPEGVTVYEADALDGGRAQPGEYVLRDSGARNEERALWRT